MVEEIAPLPARLDASRLTVVHLCVILVCTVCFAIDLAEIALGGVLGALFSSGAAQAATGQTAMLLASVYVGGTVGAPLFGLVADRYGRRTALICIMLLLATASTLGGLAADLRALTAWRLFAGFALGAYPPLMIAFLTDILPARNRGAITIAVSATALLAAPATVFAVRGLTDVQLLGLEGWQLVLMAFGALALIGAGAFAWLPESPRWVLGRRGLEAAEVQARGFLASGPHPAAAPRDAETPTVRKAPGPYAKGFLATLFFLSPWATVAFPLLSGAIFIERGFALNQTLTYIGIISFGPVIGSGLSALVVDRFTRHWTLATVVVGMALAVLAFAATPWAISMIASSVLFGICAATYVPVLNLYAAEIVPTATRGRNLTLFWSLNRAGSAIAPLLLLPLMRHEGVSAMLVVMTCTLILSLVILPFTPRGLSRLGVV